MTYSKKRKPLIKKISQIKDKSLEPISKATMYGLPVGVSASIVGANNIPQKVSDSIRGNGSLEELISDPQLGQGISDTVLRLTKTYFDSSKPSYEIIMDSSLLGGAVLAGAVAGVGYEGHKKWKNLREVKKRDKSTSKKISDGLQTAYHTAVFGAVLPLQVRLGHTIANSINGVDVWGSVVKPAITYITNL